MKNVDKQRKNEILGLKINLQQMNIIWKSFVDYLAGAKKN